MKRLKKAVTAASVVIFSTAIVTAQSSNPVSFSITSGIKTSRFQEVQKRVTAYNPSPNYKESDINPEVKNSVSFFAGMYTSKPLNKRFSVSNTLALDMQQLSVTSGFQKQISIGNQSVYTTTDNSDLLARLKLDFGIHYNIMAEEKKKLSVGIRAGQMIALSNKTNSYSIIGTDLRFERKGNAFFVSGTLSPYRVKIKGLEHYVGNMNAEQVTASYSFRIYEVNIGYAVRM